MVEFAQASDGADDVGGLVHDDYGGGAEAGLVVFERVEVHELLVAGCLRENGGGGSAGDDGFEVVPAADDAAGVFLDELFEGDRHAFFDCGRVVDVPGDAEEFRAGVALAAELVEPVGAAADDGGSYGDGLDVGDCAGAAEEADRCWKWGLEAGFAGFAFKGFDEGGFFAADVGAHAAVEEDVEVVAGAAGVFAEEAGLVGFLDGALEDGTFVVEFAADVDVGCCAL